MTNQLALEKSPYLLQHAHNPVDWMAWGEAAFQKARDEDKPIFLSVGYSTCHWCHVMERESFENDDTARYLNEHFVSIKVDREERPDVDRVYMTFVQATSGSGGWPMTVFLTPDLKPFFGGTYFPPQDAYGRIGFPALLERLSQAWQSDRAKIEESGENVLQMLRDYAALQPSGVADWSDILEACHAHLADDFDSRYGGFGSAPKFPRPVTHDFLHRYAFTHPDSATQTIQMSGFTLRAMSTGGMNDQLGGGFHRYSVDEQWIVSHFEKMLYDQAQLVNAYLEMFQLTGEDRYAQTARGTLDYVLRDMTHEQGGFFSAEDADSWASHAQTHKEEGAFYVWTSAEIERILGDDAPLFHAYYGVKPNGNAPRSGDPHGEFKGKNILFVAQTLSEITKKFGRDAADVAASLESSRQKLFEARESRPRPHRDDKIIVAWNGLMISAFARAAQVLDEPRYLQAAQRAADFLRQELFDAARNTLRRHFKDGAADVPAFADDYAFLINGLLDLYEASFEMAHLSWAETLMETLNRDFYDEQSGGYFNAAPDPRLGVRMKEDYDGAEPSANSLAALALLRMSDLLDRADLRERAEATLNTFASRLSHAPHAMPEMLCAALRLQQAPLHIVIVGNRDAHDTRALLQTVHAHFLPFKTLMVVSGQADDAMAQRLPFVAEMKLLEGQATAYVCQNFACQRPVTTPEELHEQLETGRS